MNQREVALTAVFLKSDESYIGFVEELPGVNAHGRTLGEARDTLRTLVGVIFDEERRGMEEMLVGKDCMRESLVLESTPRLAEESMDMTDVSALARHLFAMQGARAIAEAAQKTESFAGAGDQVRAKLWRRVEAVLREMRGPRQG